MSLFLLPNLRGLTYFFVKLSYIKSLEISPLIEY